MLIRDGKKQKIQDAKETPFSFPGYSAEDVEDAITETNTKAGEIPPANFTGALRSYTVTFTTAYPDDNYAVTVTGEDGRAWTIR